MPVISSPLLSFGTQAVMSVNLLTSHANVLSAHILVTNACDGGCKDVTLDCL